MTRYYFHLLDFSGSVIEDEEGSDLLSLTAAREHAVSGLRELVTEAVKYSHEAEVDAILVADERGTQLAAVPLVSALPPTVVGLLRYPEKIVPKNRFEEYRRNADECRAKAESATDPDDQTSWLKLANAWLLMLPQSHAAAAEVIGWPKASDEDSQASH